LDADTFTKKEFNATDLDKFLNPKAELAFLGRKHFDYSETSFMGFNLKYRGALDLLGDLRGAYNSGEVLNYREWHDGFIFERLLTIYRAHGMRVQDFTGHLDIKDLVKGKQAFESFPLSDFMEHLKGDRKLKVKGKPIPPAQRYKQLADIIRQYQPARVVETGTWIGQRAIEMALASFENRDDFHYIGHDLFEEGNEELSIKELNAKRIVSVEDITKHLNEFKDKMKEKDKIFTFELIKGDTNQTLQDNIDADLAYIDGGHSTVTVQNDYNKLKHIPVVVFDDFFSADQDGNCVEPEFQEVNRIMEQTTHRKYVLPSSDGVREGGFTHLAVMLTDPDIPDLTNKVMQVPIHVTPKDCVPDQNLVSNIKKNIKLIDNWLEKGRAHSDRVIIVSGGSSTDWDHVKELSRRDNTRIVCVKHSYPHLLKHGIQPWGCVILDPRPLSGKSTHGVIRKTLFNKVDKNTIFFLASMTNPSVTRLLKKQGANLWGWHAFSDTLRSEGDKNKPVLDNTINVSNEFDIPSDTTFITGGTCAAMRAIGMMHVLGFRTFDLFGYDCIVPEPSAKDKTKKERDGRPKWMNVTVDDHKFWTTGELLAMAQDCEKLFERDDVDMDITVHGENTLVSTLWEKSRMSKVKNYKEFLPC
jgi:predicted O-methyltransferase YrrM